MSEHALRSKSQTKCSAAQPHATAVDPDTTAMHSPMLMTWCWCHSACVTRAHTAALHNLLHMLAQTPAPKERSLHAQCPRDQCQKQRAQVLRSQRSLSSLISRKQIKTAVLHSLLHMPEWTPTPKQRSLRGQCAAKSLNCEHSNSRGFKEQHHRSRET